MCEIGYDSSKGGGNKVGEPKEVIIVNEDIRNNGKKCVVK